MTDIIVLPLRFQADNLDFFIYPVVLKDNNGLYLIDCAYPGFLKNIEEAFKKYNLDIKDLKKIIITHHDHDHMGGLNEIIQKYPQIEVLCTEKQKPYIIGEEKSLRLSQMEKINSMLSEEEQKANKNFMDMLRSIKPISKANVINDNDIIPICGGIKAIITEGHMPGHLSLYAVEKKILISGDALISENGQLCIADEKFVMNKEKEIESVEKLCNYEIKKIICYHGGEYESKNICQELKNITEKGYSNIN